MLLLLRVAASPACHLSSTTSVLTAVPINNSAAAYTDTAVVLNKDNVLNCVDVSFVACLPSLLAVSSISAAASGLLGHVWCRHVNLLRRLQQLTNIDTVSSIVRMLLVAALL